MAKSNRQQTPVQLELFTAASMMYVDPKAEHIAADVDRQLTAATSVKRHAIYSLETIWERFSQVTSFASSERWELCGHTVSVNPKRLKTFQSNYKCVCCGIEGNAFLVEQHVNNDSAVQSLNLYHLSASQIVLITVDHILPDSLGGRYSSDNFQTMCSICNQKKTNTMSMEEIALVRSDYARFVKSWYNVEYLELLLYIQEKIHTTKDQAVCTKWKQLLERYRRRIQSSTRQSVIQQRAQSMRSDIRELEGIHKCGINVVPATEPVFTWGLLKNKMKQWFAANAVVQAATRLARLRFKVVVIPHQA